MPTIFVDKDDFSRLMGEQVEIDKLEEILDLVKGEYKGEDEEGRLRIELNDTNRPDLWSAEGIARQLRCASGKRRDYPFFSGEPGGQIMVEPAMRSIRPYVAAFIVEGVEVNQSSLLQIIQTQEKLAENFGRRRKDVAIGVYNLRKITFPIHYRCVDPARHSYTPLGEQAPMTLSEILARHPKGVEYGWILSGMEQVPLLIDEAGMTLSMPPIINSREVGEVTPGDSDLFVEATGENLDSLILALNIMACDMADRGGRISRVRTSYPYDTPLGREVDVPMRLSRSISIPISEFSRLLGLPVRATEVDNVLERYGCDVAIKGETVDVQPPPTRLDYLHSVDVIEDFAIARGYETFVPSMPRDFSVGRSDPVCIFEDKARDHMIGLGYEEVVSNLLVSHAQVGARMNNQDKAVVEIGNMMNENHAVLRDAVLPSLLACESRSAAAAYPHRIFEAGEAAIFDAELPLGSRTEMHLAALIAHREANLSEIHADLDFLLFQLGEEVRLEEIEHPSFIPGRAAKVFLSSGRYLGLLGEVHPEVLRKWEISVPVAAFEIDLESMV
jgi:phenylalanyl-tRNA synthetase beta chain